MQCYLVSESLNPDFWLNPFEAFHPESLTTDSICHIQHDPQWLSEIRIHMSDSCHATQMEPRESLQVLLPSLLSDFSHISSSVLVDDSVPHSTVQSSIQSYFIPIEVTMRHSHTNSLSIVTRRLLNLFSQKEALNSLQRNRTLSQTVDCLFIIHCVCTHIREHDKWNRKMLKLGINRLN